MDIHKGLAVKDLKLSHFLEHLEEMVNHATDIKELCSRA